MDSIRQRKEQAEQKLATLTKQAQQFMIDQSLPYDLFSLKLCLLYSLTTHSTCRSYMKPTISKVMAVTGQVPPEMARSRSQSRPDSRRSSMQSTVRAKSQRRDSAKPRRAAHTRTESSGSSLTQRSRDAHDSIDESMLTRSTTSTAPSARVGRERTRRGDPVAPAAEPEPVDVQRTSPVDMGPSEADSALPIDQPLEDNSPPGISSCEP